jgi:hypothetical protein
MTLLTTEELASVKADARSHWLWGTEWSTPTLPIHKIFSHIDTQQHQIDKLTQDKNDLATMVGTLSDLLDGDKHR